MNESIFDIKAREYGIKPFPEDPVVAMAYILYQNSTPENIYSAEQGMQAGTMFADLNKPFEGTNRRAQ